MNWQQYTEFLTQWAAASMGFDTTVRRVSELPGLVYLEIEERHTRPGGVAVVNSLSVYESTKTARSATSMSTCNSRHPDGGTRERNRVLGGKDVRRQPRGRAAGRARNLAGGRAAMPCGGPAMSSCAMT